MIRNGTTYIVAGLIIFSPNPAHAESSLVVRPQAGYGYLDAGGSGGSGGVGHAGVRVLLGAGGNKRYGLEATRFSMEDSRGFGSLGIVLEQRLWSWFNMSIGTVGYFGYGANSENPVGLMTNLGWEPGQYKGFTPFVTYRNDIIFSRNTDVVHSVSLGVAFGF
ncbi:MAG TPA: hypothetical protein ENJ43_00345 [Gammaproteobacteria bacterium]|nr:hypothetical protein [Gammaproteobacteria bacterium]